MKLAEQRLPELAQSWMHDQRNEAGEQDFKNEWNEQVVKKAESGLDG